jgi:hypothetical protein
VDNALSVLQRNSTLKKVNVSAAITRTATVWPAEDHPITVLPAATSIFLLMENANFV